MVIDSFSYPKWSLFRDKKKHCVSSAIFWVQILAKRDLYVTQNSIPAYIFQNLAAAKVKILPKIEAFSTAECTPLWKLRGLQEITPRNPRILRLGLTGGGSDQLRIFSCCSWHCPGRLYHWPWICTFIIIRPQNLFFCCEKSVGANRLKFKFPAIKSAARIKEGGGGGMFRQITKCFFWQVYLSHFCYSRTNFFVTLFWPISTIQTEKSSAWLKSIQMTI